MKDSLHPQTTILVALLLCAPCGRATPPSPPVPSGAIAAQGIDFSWRTRKGDFRQDRPGYLILTTEDAVQWSRVLPEFVKQKEHMGFHVYVATEQDYGTGQTGNAQAKVVRAWMREFDKRANLKYALLIGNGSGDSSDLPSPRGHLEAGYCDLDGKWVDLLLDGKDPSGGGSREDEVIMSRITYVGDEIGNSAYDLDRILQKTIRYERETEAGKNLDWRASVHSFMTNYGESGWDHGLIQATEQQGGTFEWRSERGVINPYIPENLFDGQPTNGQFVHQNRRYGMVCSMSHGWCRGGEGTIDHQQLLSRMDSRFPSAVSVTACEGFALYCNCNLGQSLLRRGAIFALGTAISNNNNRRASFQTDQLEKRMSVGEAGMGNDWNVLYGDPSLHVLPLAGGPVRELQIEPAYAAHYEERTQEKGRAVNPVAKTYTLTNHSKKTMEILVECNARWVSLSESAITLRPGDSTRVEVKTRNNFERMNPGVHIASIRFVRSDGQRDERRLAVKLVPASLEMAYSFDKLVEGKRFEDVSLEPTARKDDHSLWVIENWGNGSRIPGYSAQSRGKVGGALHLDHPATLLSRSITSSTQWRGASASFWLKVDALPADGKKETILTDPFALTLGPNGVLKFAQGGEPVQLGKIASGEWHLIQFRSDIEGQKTRARLDGKREVIGNAGAPPVQALTLGSFVGAVDEIRVWSCELSDAGQAAEFSAARMPFIVPPAPGIDYVNDGVLRVPKDLPSVFNLVDAKAKLDVSGILAVADLKCVGLREAPEWLDFSNGVFSMNPAMDFDHLDYGGYDLRLVLKARDGRVAEHPLKVCVPVPAVNIRLVRAADDMISFVNAGDHFGNADRPLAKGVIRYTTDGSPVMGNSPIYDKPFKMSGKDITARFFYLDMYPMAPVTLDAQFGLPHDSWRVTEVSGDEKSRGIADKAFDGNRDTVWRNQGGSLPQFLAWDLGKEERLRAIAVHSTIRDAGGRIKGFVLYVSDDNKNWSKVKEGELQSSPSPVKITFDSGVKAKFLKLEATSLYAGTDMVITELEVFAK
jgi:hypothetical protein